MHEYMVQLLRQLWKNWEVSPEMSFQRLQTQMKVYEAFDC